MSQARYGLEWSRRSDAPALGRGVLASLLFHGLLLAAGFSGLLSRPLQAPSARPPLQISLLAPAPAAVSVAASAAASAAAFVPRRPLPSAPAIQPWRETKSMPVAAPKLMATSSSSSSSSPAAAAPSAAAEPAPLAAAAPARGAETAAAVSEAAAVRPAAQPSLDGYAQTLSALLARQRSYPQLAAMRGWEGEVRLTLRIARRGALLDVQVSRSSGYEVLDRNALQLVQQASPLPVPPEGFEGSEIQISVPIQYKLKKSS